MALLLEPLSASAAVITTGCSNTNVSCTLQELVGGATIQVDDWLFSSWQIEIDPGTVNYGLVDVAGQSGADPGLLFIGNGELVAAGGDFLDLRFGYVVTVTDEPIRGNALEITSSTVIGTGRILLEEAVFSLPFREIGVKTTEVDPAYGTADLLDEIEFAEQQSLFIEKEIFIEGSDANAFAELEQFEQRYVPEPTRLSLLLTGVAFLMAAPRRRRLAGSNEAASAFH
jgi:hypothetical protein